MRGDSGPPRLYCPFDEAISPHAERVDEEVLAWAGRFALLTEPVEVERFRRTRVGRLAARTSPRSEVAALVLLAAWQLWLFVFDDRHCDETEKGADLQHLSRLITSFICVLDGGDDARWRVDPLTTALADVKRRVWAITSAGQALRFISAVRGYFLALYWEAAHRAADSPAGLAEYQLMRRHSGAVLTCIALIDVAGGFEVRDDELWRPEVRAVTETAVNAICWANDVLSYAKESERSLKLHSLPAVLGREAGLPAGQALAAAAARHDTEVGRFVEAERRVRASASPELRRYLDGLRDWIAGNMHWSLETGRYALGPGA